MPPLPRFPKTSAFEAKLTGTLLEAAEEANLVLLRDWGADPNKSSYVDAERRTAKVFGRQ